MASLALATLPPQHPIIGIYTQDAEDFGQQMHLGQTFIAASYVKNIEMAGAQVVPIFYNSSPKQLEDLLSKINGVLLPGGAVPIDRDNLWTSNIQAILDHANKQNDLGNPYPIWATCLSYEAIMYLSSGRKDNMTVLTRVEGQLGLPGSLTIRDNNSALIRALSTEEYEDLTTGSGVVWFDQNWAVTLQTYEESEGINSFWRLVSTSTTSRGVEQVSTVEARKYPYFMVQYHPENNCFEWNIAPVRSGESIRGRRESGL
jgi:gamma-glutamyl hydrolase